MKTLDLTGIWEAYLPQKIEVTVPGCFDEYMHEKDFAKPVRFTKTFNIEKKADSNYQLCCGAVSYFCEVKLNQVNIGCHEGMWDAFRFDITDALKNGENQVEFYITKPGYNNEDEFPLRQVLSGFIPDVLCTFGGIWDYIYVEESAIAFFDYHYAKGNQVGDFSIVLGVNKVVNKKVCATIDVAVNAPDGSAVFSYTTKKTLTNEDLIFKGSIENPVLWNSHTPKLYTYHVTVSIGEECIALQKTFGFRTVSAKGTHITINDIPVYLRGVLHWGYYDKTFIPNPSRDTVENELNGITDYGFNLVKHCLYIPRDTYLRSCDEHGVLQWIELPLWLPEQSEHLSERIKREYPRIIRSIAGHPSVVLTSLGCELDDKVDSAVLEEMYNLLKKQTDTLVKDNSGSGECYGGLKIEYADFFDYHFYADLQNFENLLENFTPNWRNTKPWLFGEFCDSDVMRNLHDVRKKYNVKQLMWETGDKKSNPISVLKPDFYAHHHDERIKKSGILERFEAVHELSINHSLVHRKTTLELTRSQPVVGGYNITSLRDVPLCANGMFDDFGEARFDAYLFKNSNADDVLCPAWDLGRIWLSADRVQPSERFNFISGSEYALHILFSHYSPKHVNIKQVKYALLDGDDTIFEAFFPCDEAFDIGEVKKLGYIRFTLPQSDTPKNFLLHVEVQSGANIVQNEWPIFVYPKPEKTSKAIAVYDGNDTFRGIEKIYNTHILTDEEVIDATNTDAVFTVRLTSEIKAYARQGGHVVLVQKGDGSLPVRHCSFWREGMLWQEETSFLSQLPYLKPYDDLRFYSVGCESAFCPNDININEFKNYRPILRRYDCREWLAHDYIATMQCGKGKIVATTLRLDGSMGKQTLLIENNCFGKWLLEQMLNAE